MRFHIKDNGYVNQATLLKKNVEERIQVDYATDGMIIELCVDKVIKAEESYSIASVENGWKIIGSDEVGLYYGIGKF